MSTGTSSTNLVPSAESNSRGNSLRPYGVAIACVIGATLFRLAIDPLVGIRFPFTVYFFAIAFISWRYGLRPTLVTIGLAVPAAFYFLTSPRLSFATPRIDDLVGLGLFLFIGLTLAFLSESAHQARREVESSLGRVLQKQRELEAEIKQRQIVEAQLLESREQLERRVRERTAELAAANASLQDEVAERTRAEASLAEYALKLERSNRELEQFASVASHDLQEPLRKIQAFGDRLDTKFTSLLGEQGQDYIHRIRSAADRMRTLINDLLAFSRVATKPQPFEEVDLSLIARDVVDDLEERLRECSGRVELGELPCLEADPLQMRQLLQNLVGNGLKFHKPDQPPVVRLAGKIMKNGHTSGDPPEVCQLIVEDNGIGFEEVYADRIFQIFQRLHGRNDYEGTGIGLAICRKIVERHGGKIEARSRPGEGARFLVTLPTRHETASAPPSSSGSTLQAAR